MLSDFHKHFHQTWEIIRIDEVFLIILRSFLTVPEDIRKEGGVARIDDMIVAAEQGNDLALAFHPELTEDLRVHRYFLDKLF